MRSSWASTSRTFSTPTTTTGARCGTSTGPRSISWISAGASGVNRSERCTPGSRAGGGWRPGFKPSSPRTVTAVAEPVRSRSAAGPGGALDSHPGDDATRAHVLREDPRGAALDGCRDDEGVPEAQLMLLLELRGPTGSPADLRSRSARWRPGAAPVVRFRPVAATDTPEDALSFEKENTLALWGSCMARIALGRFEEGIATAEQAVAVTRRGPSSSVFWGGPWGPPAARTTPGPTSQSCARGRPTRPRSFRRGGCSRRPTHSSWNEFSGVLHSPGAPARRAGEAE